MAMTLTIIGAATVSLSFMRLLDVLEHPQKNNRPRTAMRDRSGSKRSHVRTL